MAPTTPSRKAIMPPPPPLTPRTPSNALVIRQPPGPLVSTTATKSSVSRSTHIPSVTVKRELDSTPGPSTPSRVVALRTPPSTSLVRRLRSITPSPRIRKSSSTPLRTRAPALSSSAAFKAKLAEVRSKTSRRRSQTPSSASHSGQTRNSSVTVEDDEDDDEVQFWKGSRVRGSTVDVAIELCSDSDESPPPSPTPSTFRGGHAFQSLVHSSSPISNRSNATPGPTGSNRSERAESTFSLTSFGSRATPFTRAPTWDDSDQRYGRKYPKDGPPRELIPTAATSFSHSSSIPLPLTSAIERMSDLISSFKPKIPKEDIKRGQEERFMSLEEKLSIVMESSFSNEVTYYDGELMKRLKDQLAASDISSSTFDLLSIIKFFKSSLHQSLKSSINEYRAEQSYKGNKEVRRNLWFSDFKVYLKFATPTLGDRINKETMETILLYLHVALNEKNAMKHTVTRLEDNFDDCNNPKIMKLLDAMIDLCAAIVNIAFAK
nr:uncharacterized protein I203_07526 [Kwoniella mangroviensis CBS 8507]OCF63456.1 hypothetical protein I203_07526 [Kwoniella mangroviensis CBS 8507]